MSRYRTPRPLRVTGLLAAVLLCTSLVGASIVPAQRPSPMIHGPVSYSIFSTTVQ